MPDLLILWEAKKRRQSLHQQLLLCSLAPVWNIRAEVAPFSMLVSRCDCRSTYASHSTHTYPTIHKHPTHLQSPNHIHTPHTHCTIHTPSITPTNTLQHPHHTLTCTPPNSPHIHTPTPPPHTHPVAHPSWALATWFFQMLPDVLKGRECCLLFGFQLASPCSRRTDEPIQFCTHGE